MKSYRIEPFYPHSVRVRNEIVYANDIYDLVNTLYPYGCPEEEELKELEEQLTKYHRASYHDFYISERILG